MKGWFIILCFVTNYGWAQPEQLDPLQQSLEKNKATTPSQQKSYSMNDDENSMNEDPMELTGIMEAQRTMFLITCISITISVIFGLVIIYSHHEKRRTYRSLNDLNFSISEKNEEITQQANQLARAYENMWKTNQRLEEEVNLRTEKIRLQSKKLIEYTNFNSHKLRGPIASFLGLLALIQTEEMSDNVKEMLQMLNTSANELDGIVREFTQDLDSEL